MTRARAEVGDLVKDEQGRRAIVTDIKQSSTWVLRPPWGGMAAHWETEDPDSLEVLEARASRRDREREVK